MKIKHHPIIRYIFAVIILLIRAWNATAVDTVLMRIGNYEFDVSDFTYVYRKNNLIDRQQPDECLSLYVPYKLKIIAAKEAGLDTLSSIAEEWAGYCKKLTDKYLTDEIVDRYLLREAYSRSLYRVKVSHIMLKLPDADTLTMYNKIMKIRQEALSGKDFGYLAGKYSDDPTVKANHGQLGYFSVFQMAYPFETAAYRTPVGEVSLPVRTASGYHIIKVDGCQRVEPVMPYESAKPELRQKIIRSDRMSAGTGMLIAQLKKSLSFTEDTSLLKYVLPAFGNTKFDDTALFSFAGQDYRLSDMKQYLSETGYVWNMPFPSVVQAYQQYAAHVLMEYKKQQIEHDKDYQHIAGEYCDGLLLFKISEREVWMKAAQDSTGLMSFYKKNARSFRWGQRMDATVYYCADEETATAMQRLVNTKNTYMPADRLSLRGTDSNIYQKVDTVRQVLPKSENTIASRIKWKKGCSKILEWNGKFVFLDVHAILRPARKTFLKARGEVIAGYQQELERQWINRLMKTYPVTIDEVVWRDLKKKYAE